MHIWNVLNKTKLRDCVCVATVDSGGSAAGTAHHDEEYARQVAHQMTVQLHNILLSIMFTTILLDRKNTSKAHSTPAPTEIAGPMQRCADQALN